MRRHLRRAVFHDGLTVLECHEEGLLDELLVLPELRDAVVRLFPPRFALIDSEHLDRVRTLLCERGWPPRARD